MNFLFFVKHGTPINSGNRGLFEKGVKEVRSIAKKLEEYCESPIILSLPKVKAMRTSKILSNVLDVRILKRPNLGCFETVYGEDKLNYFGGQIIKIQEVCMPTEIIVSAHAETLANLVPYFIKNNFPDEFQIMENFKNYSKKDGILRDNISCVTGYKIDCDLGICLRFD